MEVAVKKIRMSRTTPQQYEIYLNELQQNPHLRENKFTADQPDILKKSWGSLTNKLNSSGGPLKNVAGWKKTFADWKSQVRKRARTLQMSEKETGTGGTPEKPFTELESKLLFITGDVVVKGLANIQEIGIPNTENVDLSKDEMETEVPIKLPNKKNKGNPKTTISSTIEKFLEAKDGEISELKKINANLEKIIEQNRIQIGLMQKKIELKYNVTFEDTETNKNCSN